MRRAGVPPRKSLRHSPVAWTATTTPSGGRPGVDRTIEILQGQIERTMRLLGVKSLDELEPGHVSALRRLG